MSSESCNTSNGKANLALYSNAEGGRSYPRGYHRCRPRTHFLTNGTQKRAHFRRTVRTSVSGDVLSHDCLTNGLRNAQNFCQTVRIACACGRRLVLLERHPDKDFCRALRKLRRFSVNRFSNVCRGSFCRACPGHSCWFMTNRCHRCCHPYHTATIISHIISVTTMVIIAINVIPSPYSTSTIVTGHRRGPSPSPLPSSSIGSILVTSVAELRHHPRRRHHYIHLVLLLLL